MELWFVVENMYIISSLIDDVLLVCLLSQGVPQDGLDEGGQAAESPRHPPHHTPLQ